MDNTMEVGKPVAVFALTLVAGLLLTGARAETKFVGYQERRVENIATDTTESESTYLRVDETGELLKVGVGLWTLPLSVVSQPWPFGVSVGEGSLDLTAGTPAAPTPIEPPAVMQDAQIWLEADDASYFKTTTEHGSEIGKTYVDKWIDRRDDPASDTRAYPYAKAYYKGSALGSVFNTAPEVSAYGGQPSVWFGGVLSGRSMDFFFPNDVKFSDQATVVTDYFKFGGATTYRQRTRSFFIVHAIENGQGWLVGASKDQGTSYSIHWGKYSTTELNRQIMGDYNDTNTGSEITGGYAQNRNTWIDGSFVDFRMTNCTAGAFLYEVETTAESMLAEALMSERHHFISATDIRDGGDHVMAYVAFTKELSPEERIQVREYLMRKYLPGKLATRTRRVSVATGASVGFESDVKLLGHGDAVKKGAGDAVVLTDARRPNFAGAVELEEGGLVLKETVPLKPTTAGVSYGVTSGLQTEGIVIERTATDAGVLEKTGAAALGLTAVPSDTAKLNVRAGELALQAQIASAEPELTTAPAVVSIANAGFETANTGWTFTGGGSFAYVTPPNTAWSFGDPAPEGNCFVRITQNRVMSQDVSVPVAGTYEISYWTRTRAEGGHIVDLSLVSKETSEEIHVARPSSPTPGKSGIGWVRACFRVKVPTSGTYTLRFKGLYADDFTTAIDDIRMVQVADDPDYLWRVPGGDFETVDFNHDNRPAAQAWSIGAMGRWFNISNRVENWEFEVGPYTDDTKNFDAAAILPAVGVVQASMLQANGTTGFWYGYSGGGSFGIYFANKDPRHHGLGQLLFTTNGAVATVTCKPPAGTWQVQADLLNGFRAFSGTTYSIVPKVKIYADTGAGFAYLGHIYAHDAYGREFRAYKSAKAFTCDGETTVRIKFESEDVASGRRGCTLDNICLTKQYGVWLENPSFCMGTRSVAVPPGSRSVANCWDVNWPATGVVNVEDATLNAANWGLDTWDNAKLVALCGLGGVSQPVHFPVAGTYVATVPCRNRKDNTAQQQVLDLNLIRDGVTNTVGRIRINSLTFQRHRVIFQVPEAGDWRFELKGTLNNYGTALVDCPSIDYLQPTQLTPPTIPEETEIAVAKDATLRLDFTGVKKVARYSYDGHRYHGVLNAANCPGLSGGGSIEVPERGLLILLR